MLAGPAISLREAVDQAAAIGEHRPPSLRMPTSLLRLLAPAGGLIGQPNIREVIAASAGVTYWAGHDKATAELGFEPRPIEAGLRDTFRPA